jgi:alkaline phosphatase D
MSKPSSRMHDRTRFPRALLIGLALYSAACSARAQTDPGDIRQSASLQSGPMVGYSDMREVMLWVQTTGPANVQFVYWDTPAPGTRHRTRGEMTRVENAYTTKQVAGGLEPGRGYA